MTMRRLYTLFIIALLCQAGAVAQDMGSGLIGSDAYYRVRNFGQDRYVYVRDNYDGSNLIKQTGDFQAIELWKDASKTISDPASVIFIHKFNNGQYDLQAQGTGVLALTGYTVHISDRLSDGTYKVYATKEGVTVYLDDERTNSRDQGMLGTKNSNDKFRRWVVDKIETNHATNYFGIKPTITLNGKYYRPFYAAFPFKPASQNMHVYYVSKLTGSEATLKEITGEIPANTPVIIECASENPSDNRIDILLSTPAAVNNNQLAGVYFCNGDRGKESVDAYTAFNASTMRVLTATGDKLVFSNNETGLLNSNVLKKIEAVDWNSPNEDDIEVVCIPSNTCYLKAEAGMPDVLDVVLDGSGLDEILAENKDDDAVGVYSLSGMQIRSTNDVQGLPAGLYIVGGVKVVIK